MHIVDDISFNLKILYVHLKKHEGQYLRKRHFPHNPNLGQRGSSLPYQAHRNTPNKDASAKTSTVRSPQGTGWFHLPESGIYMVDLYPMTDPRDW